MKTVKRVVKVTFTLICLVAAIFIVLLGFHGMAENVRYGLFDSDFMNATFFAVSGIGLVIMAIEKLIGRKFKITFEKES